MEGGKWSGAYNSALAGIGKNELFKQMAVAGIFYHLYNQVCSMPAITPFVPLHFLLLLVPCLILRDVQLLPEHCT